MTRMTPHKNALSVILQLQPNYLTTTSVMQRDSRTLRIQAIVDLPTTMLLALRDAVTLDLHGIRPPALRYISQHTPRGGT